MSKSPSLRRIQADIRELALDPSDRYHAAPLENDMFEWHFTIRGADGTDFEGGIYHGRILLPPEYPFKPPNIVFLTPSGRFETNTKVCLSFSAFHPELWQPAWGIRLILEALISFLPTPADGAIGALDWSPKERKRLAKQSQTYCCPACGPIAALIPKKKTARDSKDKGDDNKPNRFQKELEHLHQLQQQEHTKTDGGGDAATEDTTATNGDNDNQQEETTVEQSTTAGAPTSESVTPPDLVTDRSLGVSPPPQPDDDKQAASPRQPPASQTTTNGPDGNVPARQTDDVPQPQGAVPAVPDDQQQQQVEQPLPAQELVEDGSWMMDPLLQAMIAILSVICYLLARKVHALSEDLKALEW